jgi:two-component system, LytTR family, response regulator
MIRTLIVDDMLLARTRLRRHLGADPSIEIVGECSGGREAIEAIKSQRPDLVFLDVQMPEVGGFEVLDEVGPDAVPAVIFVTAHDEFALRAFEVHALDYLLKPFDEERLSRALDRVKRVLSAADRQGDQIRALLAELGRDARYPRRLAIRADGRTVFLPVDDIDYIEAAGNYVRIQAGQQSHMIRERLSRMEEKLPPGGFARIHKSAIVNVERIREMQPLFNGDQTLILRTGKTLTLSRTYREKVIALLSGRATE